MSIPGGPSELHINRAQLNLHAVLNSLPCVVLPWPPGTTQRVIKDLKGIITLLRSQHFKHFKHC